MKITSPHYIYFLFVFLYIVDSHCVIFVCEAMNIPLLSGDPELPFLKLVRLFLSLFTVSFFCSTSGLFGEYHWNDCCSVIILYTFGWVIFGEGTKLL